MTAKKVSSSASRGASEGRRWAARREQGVHIGDLALDAADPGAAGGDQVDVVGGAHRLAAAMRRATRGSYSASRPPASDDERPSLGGGKAARGVECRELAERCELELGDARSGRRQGGEAAREGTCDWRLESVEHDPLRHGEAPVGERPPRQRRRAPGQQLVHQDRIAHRPRHCPRRCRASSRAARRRPQPPGVRWT